jgi:hypothetical protein
METETLEEVPTEGRNVGGLPLGCSRQKFCRATFVSVARSLLYHGNRFCQAYIVPSSQFISAFRFEMVQAGLAMALLPDGM